MKSLDFPSAGNVILKLLEQAANKTFTISGDGSTTTILVVSYYYLPFWSMATMLFL
jgi:hypothetical protein